MVKRFSMLALAGLIALPTIAVAGGGRSNAELERKVEELSRQLEELKAQMAQQNEVVTEYSDKVDDIDDLLDDRADAWDLASRFQFSGDFRARGDYYDAESVFPGGDQSNDTIMTNRLRLNMRVKATENLEFKGRLAMYKAWGMQTTPDGLGGGFPIFDGNTTRTPDDSALYVDRAFVNWTNIGGAPIWFSIGRRPTSDGPPAHLRMGTDRLATPVAYMDYPFDGLSLGYAYDWGIEALGEGRIRFCYGRGFENGLQDNSGPTIDDTDFAGINWDILQQGHRFLNIQSFGAFNLFNYPTFSSDLVNAYAPLTYGDQVNVGNIYHTSAVYMDKIEDLNYFIAGGWSRSDPNDNGMFNDYTSGSRNTSSENGYSIYAGIRYDIDNLGLKLGAEYNYGSQYWVAFSPGHDDLYMSKLATRGSAYELYMIYDLPTGEAISKFAQTFIRLGWQYYDYDYSGGFDWNMKPYDLDSEKAQLQALGLNPVESANQVYLTFEAYF
ncbi:MAG: DUF3373 family protein [Desulfobulbus sp.]